MYRQLKANRRDVAYYLYPGEGHSISGPANLLDRNLRIDNFLSKHLGGQCEFYEKPEGANVRAIHEEDLQAELASAPAPANANSDTWAHPEGPKNLIIFGVPDSAEDLLDKVKSYFGQQSGLSKSIVRVWRQGRAPQAGGPRPRPVLVEFSHQYYRSTALHRADDVGKKHGIRIRED